MSQMNLEPFKNITYYI